MCETPVDEATAGVRTIVFFLLVTLSLGLVMSGLEQVMTCAVYTGRCGGRGRGDRGSGVGG